MWGGEEAGFGFGDYLGGLRWKGRMGEEGPGEGEKTGWKGNEGRSMVTERTQVTG